MFPVVKLVLLPDHPPLLIDPPSDTLAPLIDTSPPLLYALFQEEYPPIAFSVPELELDIFPVAVNEIEPAGPIPIPLLFVKASVVIAEVILILPTAVNTTLIDARLLVLTPVFAAKLIALVTLISPAASTVNV